MSSTHKFPMQIFIIFEKIKIQTWTSKSNLPNNYFIHLPKKWLFSINNLFKFELFFWNSSLVDLSAIDYSNFSNSSKSDIFFFKDGYVLFFLYNFFFLKIKLNITTSFKPFSKEFLKSIDLIYFNANWLEREVSEMFGINFIFKKDLRKLLVDYSSVDNPLIKNYPSEGFLEIFYNFFEDQVLLTTNTSNEL